MKGMRDMKTVCKLNQCTGCAVCVDKCPRNAVSIEDGIVAFNAVIDDSLCVNCGLCEKLCPTNHPMEKKSSLLWKQGWASDESIREAASSGGIATALSVAFVKSGGVVCSCAFEKGKFIFRIAETVAQLEGFCGSKYVKSNPDGIYPEVNKVLLSGRQVLFIGLPCQSAAVQSYTNRHENLYTVDLICHGSPSPKILQKYLKEKGHNIEEMYAVGFRQKARFRLSDGNKTIEPPSVFDQYTYAFLQGLCYTENCYSCQYAQTDRVSDITLGDSWGSQLSQEEQAKGVSLVMCQSEKGKKLIDMAELHLEDVDVERAVSYNHQLSHPSVKPEEYKQFWEIFMKTNQFKNSVNRCYPSVFLRQKAKALLVKAGIMGGVTLQCKIVKVANIDINIKEFLLYRFESNPRLHMASS